jgi:FAD binding domain/Berberine and berberine like
MAIIVTHQDPRYSTLSRARNLRWPASEADAASQIDLCETAEDAAEVLQRIVHSGMRPTVRSGGHCYEDFVVNNPDGSILDLSLLTAPRLLSDGSQYRISSGQQLGEVYLNLYKRYGVTIPAGSCYSVGAGGHISGGGYGLLSRLHGLTIDWLSAVEILTVDGKGKVTLRRVDKSHDSDLFRACRGAGGGNFGVITGFLFEKLPPAPKEVVNANLSFDWSKMTEERFTTIVTTFGNYFATRGNDPETWGLFALMGLSHASSLRFGISVQFCNPDGTCNDLSVLNEFLDVFHTCSPSQEAAPLPGERKIPTADPSQQECMGQHQIVRRPWLEATIGGGGGGGAGRAKYKSAYMKRNFTAYEVKCLYQYLTKNIPGTDLRGSVVLVDSYGGAVNRSSLAEETSIWQRNSVLKLQFISYWGLPEEDAGRLKWLQDFYHAMYSGPAVDPRYISTPYPGEYYEGCYINYPDCDMLVHSFWPQLYYGEGGLYPFLQSVKRKYDPNNIFHHAMSVRG